VLIWTVADAACRGFAAFASRFGRAKWRFPDVSRTADVTSAVPKTSMVCVAGVESAQLKLFL